MKVIFIAFFFSLSVFAYEVDVNRYSSSLDFAQVMHVKASQMDDESWCFKTSVMHNDQGWGHYADGWEVLDLNGKQLGYRLLTHPHDNEQPFTRRLCDIKIAQGITQVIVRAKCNKHSFGGKTLRIDLNIPVGSDYSVTRVNERSFTQ